MELGLDFRNGPNVGQQSFKATFYHELHWGNVLSGECCAMIDVCNALFRYSVQQNVPRVEAFDLI